MNSKDITILVLSIIGGLLILGIIINFIVTMLLAKHLYFKRLVRTSKDKWGRECSDRSNEEQAQMFDEGLKWSEDKNFIDVSITSEGYKLVGKYLDNHSKTCVIIIPGRTESLLYSFYFADPYYQCGLNILVIDNRSHGLSEGYYDCIGIEEYKDIQAWAKYVSENFNNENIVLHGICIGAATSIYAKVRTQKENNIKLLVLDSPYNNFKEIFRNHIKDEKKPVQPVLNEIMYYLKKYAKVDVIKDAPTVYIDKVEIPVLFLYSNEDTFSLPYMHKEIYGKCISKYKEIHYLPYGAHAHLRIRNTKEYDELIILFLKKYIKS